MQRLPSLLVAVAAAGVLAACADSTPTPVAPRPVLATVAAGPALLINEVMADPAAVGDDVGEWVEVHNWGASAVDLQGWVIASGNDAPHTIGTSVPVPAGGHVVLGRNGTKSKNGGVTVHYAYGTGLTLANASDWVALRSATGTTVDSVAWGSSLPAGASRGTADPSLDNTDVKGSNWSTQTTVYGKGDKGTPGARNDGYLPPVTSVSLSPSSASAGVGQTQQFTATATDAGGATVSTTYTWISASPGVATVDASGLATAVAEGTTLIRATTPNGVYGEATLTVTSGGGGAGPRLVINEVMPNPAAVTDDAGEWLEVFNWGDASADLRGYAIASGNDSPHTIGSSVVVPAGGYVVLARSSDSAVNGGVSAGYAYGTALTLANTSDWVALRDGTGATVDSVSWSSTPTGASRGVVDASQNNTEMGGSNWTTQTSVYGAGDKGTPRARNDGAVTPGPAGEPATVTISPSSASATVGQTQQFSASATDAAGRTTTTTYTWTSSHPAVATVDAAGLASAVSAGTATIRATAANGVFGEATFTVNPSSTDGGGSATELVVKVLDIGQGDATYIANGTSRVFIDGGPDTTAFRRHIDALGLRGGTVDAVVISHAHFDHYSGLRELFKTSNNIRVRYLFENRDAGTAVTLAELRDSINARVARGELIVRDTDDPCGDGRAVCTVTLNGGAKLHVMRPDPAGADPNNRSTPVKLVGPDSASFSMWFAGDAEHAAQSWFDAGADYDVFPGMKVEVLKANHHGSCNGVSSRFLELINPTWVTFSLSATNTYGHVHTQTKDLFTRYGKPWYRTDRNGTVTFRSPGTAGGGYTVAVERGTASESGSPDRTSSQEACQTL